MKSNANLSVIPASMSMSECFRSLPHILVLSILEFTTMNRPKNPYRWWFDEDTGVIGFEKSVFQILQNPEWLLPLNTVYRTRALFPPVVMFFRCGYENYADELDRRTVGEQGIAYTIRSHSQLCSSGEEESEEEDMDGYRFYSDPVWTENTWQMVYEYEREDGTREWTYSTVTETLKDQYVPCRFSDTKTYRQMEEGGEIIALPTEIWSSYHHKYMEMIQCIEIDYLEVEEADGVDSDGVDQE